MKMVGNWSAQLDGVLNSSAVNVSSYIQVLNVDYAARMMPVIIFMCVTMLTGVIGNTLVVAVYSTKRMKTSANYAYMILGGLDLFACVVIHPYVLFKLFNHFNQTWVAVCKFFEFLIHSNLSVSAGILMCIAFDRYFSVCRPLQFHLSKKRIVIIATVAFSLGILCSTPILEFYGTKQIEVKGYSFTGLLCDYSDRYSGSVSEKIFGGFAFVAFIVLVAIITFLYINVGIIIYRRKRKVNPTLIVQATDGNERANSDTRPFNKNLLDQSSCSTRGHNRQIPTDTRSSGCSRTSLSLSMSLSPPGAQFIGLGTGRTNEPPLRIPQIHVQERVSAWQATLKASKLLFLVTVFFLFSWLPFWIMKIVGIVLPLTTSPDSLTTEVIQAFFNHLFYLNNAVNPLIYVISNYQFRRDCKYQLRKACFGTQHGY